MFGSSDSQAQSTINRLDILLDPGVVATLVDPNTTPTYVHSLGFHKTELKRNPSRHQILGTRRSVMHRLHQIALSRVEDDRFFNEHFDDLLAALEKKPRKKKRTNLIWANLNWHFGWHRLRLSCWLST